jgi:hypothetical protein
MNRGRKSMGLVSWAAPVLGKDLMLPVRYMMPSLCSMGIEHLDYSFLELACLDGLTDIPRNRMESCIGEERNVHNILCGNVKKRQREERLGLCLLLTHQWA